MKIRLTQQYIDNPPPCAPGKSREEHCDIALPGLYFEVRATCTDWGTFFLRYKDETGKTSHSKLGRSTDLSLKEAREAAKKLRAEIQLGRDPQAEKRQQRETMTWAQLMQPYLAHVRQHLRSSGNLEEMDRLRVRERFGSTPINRISRVAAQQFHHDLREEGLAPATCDHYLKFIRQALNMAVTWGFLDHNPVAGIKLFNVDNRQERIMDADQLQRLMTTLDNAPERRRMVALVVKYLLFTGARVDEALHARHAEIDRKNRVWKLPASNKSKRLRSIPLNDAALAVLDQLPSKGKSEWLFTSGHGDGKQRMTTINKVWQQLRQEAGLPWLRLHDMRHYYASALVNSGRTLYEVQHILGHSSHAVSERYSHLSTATLQDAANSASQYVADTLAKAGKS